MYVKHYAPTSPLRERTIALSLTATLPSHRTSRSEADTCVMDAIKVRQERHTIAPISM